MTRAWSCEAHYRWWDYNPPWIGSTPDAETAKVAPRDWVLHPSWIWVHACLGNSVPQIYEYSGYLCGTRSSEMFYKCEIKIPSLWSVYITTFQQLPIRRAAVLCPAKNHYFFRKWFLIYPKFAICLLFLQHYANTFNYKKSLKSRREFETPDPPFTQKVHFHAVYMCVSIAHHWCDTSCWSPHLPARTYVLNASKNWSVWAH